MDTRESSPQSFTPVTWPLIGSLILTTIVVAIVCVPPFSGLHSWGGLVWLACVYMLTAACVHVLAVWSIYRIQREGVREWALVWPMVWGAWIAVVWLPLVALLTYERSHWVAAIVPLAAVFLTLFVVSHRRDEGEEPAVVEERNVARGLLWMDESPRLWRVLLPSLLIAVVLDGGVAMYAANHAWMAGVLFAVAAAYFADSLLSRTAAQVKVHEGSVRRASRRELGGGVDADGDCAASLSRRHGRGDARSDGNAGDAGGASCRERNSPGDARVYGDHSDAAEESP